MTREVHLIGSAPVADARTAFEVFGSELKGCARRYPDGEPGQRHDWVLWQEDVLARHPDFQPVALPEDPRSAVWNITTYGLRPGRQASNVRFDNIGYARAAIESYGHFERALRNGTLPPTARFQVSLPTAVAFIWFFVAEAKQQATLLPAYERALVEEVRSIAAAIPGERLAIQWDAAVEPIRMERRRRRGPDRRFRDWISDIADLEHDFAGAIARLCNAVPRGVDCLLHLCYGDFGHKHLIEPSDMSVMVDLSNAVLAQLERPLELLHMPVPRGRDDDTYFAPLAALRLPAQTQLALGLVHHTDGLQGTLRRMAAAKKHAPEFAIAAECGLGRRPADSLREVLRIHAEAARA
jgi:methionine synthase II (cobalamin-independent)